MNANNSSTTEVRHLDLDANRHSAHEARAFVVETLREWGCEQLTDDVTLVVSELVTNAVVHAHSEAHLTLVSTEEGVRVNVRDDLPDPPKVRHITVEDTNGRGMLLIDALSSQWGVDPAPPGKVVWLDISRA